MEEKGSCNCNTKPERGLWDKVDLLYSTVSHISWVYIFNKDFHKHCRLFSAYLPLTQPKWIRWYRDTHLQGQLTEKLSEDSVIHRYLGPWTVVFRANYSLGFIQKRQRILVLRGIPWEFHGTLFIFIVSLTLSLCPSLPFFLAILPPFLLLPLNCPYADANTHRKSFTSPDGLFSSPLWPSSSQIPCFVFERRFKTLKT